MPQTSHAAAKETKCTATQTVIPPVTSTAVQCCASPDLTLAAEDTLSTASAIEATTHHQEEGGQQQCVIIDIELDHLLCVLHQYYE